MPKLTKIVDPSFGNIDVETEDFTLSPTLDLDILSTLARLEGWNAALNRFVRISADNQGRILTSSNTAASFNVNQVSATSPGPGTPVIVFNQNPLRKFYIVYNPGFVRACIGFSPTINNTQGYRIGNSGFYGDDFYTGPVYVVAVDSNGSTVYGLEFT